ncbi:MAG: hypothetical protein WC721_04290 [Victivallaceae bacterium]
MDASNVMLNDTPKCRSAAVQNVQNVRNADGCRTLISGTYQGYGWKVL